MNTYEKLNEIKFYFYYLKKKKKEKNNILQRNFCA